MDEQHWKQLIEARNAWIAHNFPGPDMPNTVLGMIEEMGELTHAWLKRDQGIRGSAEKHNEDMKDAIGDLTVYMLGALNHYEVIPQPHDPEDIRIGQMVKSSNLLRQMAWRVGEVARNMNIEPSINHLVYLLEVFCSQHGWSYEEIVLDTWEGVSQRDWIKYPETGMPPRQHTGHYGSTS